MRDSQLINVCIRFQPPNEEELDRNKEISAVIAIDALCGPGKYQFTQKGMERDLNKSLSGFLGIEKGEEYNQSNIKEHHKSKDDLISTGNWVSTPGFIRRRYLLIFDCHFGIMEHN